MTKSKLKKPRKDPSVYPPGWDYERVQKVVDCYDSHKDEDVLREAEIARVTANLVWMEIPEHLVPKVRKLIAGQTKQA